MDNSTSRQVLQNLFLLRRYLSLSGVGFSHTLDLSSDSAKKEMYRDKRYLVGSKCFNTGGICCTGLWRQLATHSWFIEYVQLMLYNSHKKQKNNVKYPRVPWMLLPISHLANKCVMIIGLVIRNQSIFLRAELKWQSKVLAQLSRWVGLLIKLETWDLKIFLNTCGSTNGKLCKASSRQVSTTSTSLIAMTLFQ